jgi:indolepyruvate ferredoxin oxidoreductase
VATRVFARLDAGNEAEALAILTLFDEIRGYGLVKEAATRTIMEQIDKRLKAYETTGEPARIPDAA